MVNQIEDQTDKVQNPVSEKYSSTLYKKLFFGLLAVLILFAIGSGAYYFGQNQSKKTEITPTLSALPSVYPTVNNRQELEATPSVSISTKDESVVPVGTNTVSFARVGNTTYLRYRGKVYDDANQNEPHEVSLPNLDQYTWYGLADAPSFVPQGELIFDELFGFKIAPDKKSFAFIMRWGDKNISSNSISYYLYFYSPFDKTRQTILVKKYTPDGFISYNVPKIDQFSPDSKYLSLNMYPCWNCGGSKPETLLVRIKDSESKNIGKTSYFIWKTNGAYEYKEYKVIACPPTPTGEWMGGECSEKPENLPLKSSQF